MYFLTLLKLNIMTLKIKNIKDHLNDKQIDANPLARLMLRSDFSWNSVSVLLKSLTPELSDLPLERLLTART